MHTLRSLIVFGLVALVAVPARATTSEGSLITNLASATFKDKTGVMREISYGATSWVLVATPSVMLLKVVSPTIAVSGGTVTFCITFSNASALTSAVNVVISDKVPDNVRFANALTENDPVGGNITPAWSTDNIAWSLAWPPGYGQGPATPASSVFLRWTTDVMGPRQSAIVCYSVTIQ